MKSMALQWDEARQRAQLSATKYQTPWYLSKDPWDGTIVSSQYRPDVPNDAVEVYKPGRRTNANILPVHVVALKKQREAHDAEKTFSIPTFETSGVDKKTIKELVTLGLAKKDYNGHKPTMLAYGFYDIANKPGGPPSLSNSNSSDRNPNPRPAARGPGAAAALFERFNGRPARKFKTLDISITKNLVDLGACVAVAYASSKEGRRAHYEHKFTNPTRLMATQDGKTLIISGANIRVTDWIRG